MLSLEFIELGHGSDFASSYNKSQQVALLLNFFWYRTLHVLDRFTVHQQESSIVYTAVGICHTGYADCLLARSGWILTNTYCCVYSTRLLMMESKPVCNM